MSKLTLFSALFMALAASQLIAQPPSPRGEQRDGNSGGNAESPIARLMAYDKDKDGKLTREELNDKRLASLFVRADADHDNFVTKEELTALFDKESQSQPGPGRGGPGGMRPGGLDPERSGTGGPGGPPPGEFGRGPGGPAPTRPGQVLPPFVMDELKLNDTQRQELDQLQRHVDARLSKILTAEQRDQLSQLGRRGGRPDGPGIRPRQ